MCTPEWSSDAPSETQERSDTAPCYFTGGADDLSVVSRAAEIRPGYGIAADKLASLLPASAAVLDAGCGSGLTGAALAERGFRAIDGIDMAEDMLAMATRRGVYRRLSHADLTLPLDLPDDSYDGVLCVGVFDDGHIGPASFWELARVARPGGVVVATVHETVWSSDGYARLLESIAHAGRARIREAAVAPYQAKAGDTCRLCVLEAV